MFAPPYSSRLRAGDFFAGPYFFEVGRNEREPITRKSKWTDAASASRVAKPVRSRRAQLKCGTTHLPRLGAKADATACAARRLGKSTTSLRTSS